MQFGKLRAHRCSRIINGASQLVHEYILNIGFASNGKSDAKSKHGETCCMTPQKLKTKVKMTSMQQWEARRMICQHGWRNSLNCWWTT